MSERSPEINIEQRLAHEIQSAVVHEASMTDYYLGRAERDDIAHDYILHLIDQNACDDYTAYQALYVWRTIYNKGER